MPFTFNTVYQRKNAFGLVGDYFGRRVTLFMLMFVLLRRLKLVFYQLCLQRYVTSGHARAPHILLEDVSVTGNVVIHRTIRVLNV